MGKIPRFTDGNILVGFETFDDAGVYRIDSERALVQTVDFFTPVVDDPYTYGAIAAANSLSDIYAMGGRPITALAIACFPEKGGDMDILAQIMVGGADKLREAQVPLLGGHTVTDPEIKFGYAISGLVHPDRIMTNAGARPADILVLTKPLGIGILTSGIKFHKTSPEGAARATEVMTALNRTSAETMAGYSCHSATDITGYGLLGHANNMAAASNVTLRFFAGRIPFIQEAYALAEAGVLPRTIALTWGMIENQTHVNPSIAKPTLNILLDPQTSGGLLISVDPNHADLLLKDLVDQGIEAAAVGQVEKYDGKRLRVE